MPNRFLAVTGTNGKTTTVELLGHLYRTRRRAGRGRRQRRHAALLAGRRGRARRRPSSARPPASSSRTRVAFAPECAVFLNLAPDHLDRHRDLESYLAAKLRIFANQGNDDVAVYNADDPALAGTDLGGCARRVAFCVGAAPDCEVALAEGTIFYDGEPLLAVAELGLFGEHNVANAMAAAAAALSMGLDRDAVREGLRSFAGVPHRLEQVAEIGGVRFVNDSKATNVASATVGHARLRGRRPRDPRRQREGRGLRAAARAGPRALRRLLPDRRHRRAARRGAGAGRRGRGRAAPLRRPRGRRAPRRRRGRGPARSSCSRPPAPASTPSRTSNAAASASARSSGSCDERRSRCPGRRRGEGRQEGRSKKRRSARRQPAAPSTTCCSPRPSACWRCGAVMVFSASSTTQVLSDGGLSDSAFYLKRTLMFGAVGLLVMHLVARHGLQAVRRLTPAAPRRLLLPAGRRARRRHHGQRLQPLDRLRLPADPALGARQGGAGPLRRRPARAQAEAGANRSKG